MKSLIYLHGFNSSPHSEKARLTQTYFAHDSSRFKVCVPALPARPKDAINVVDELVTSLGEASIAGFIGSSLGGYYSLYCQQRYQLPIVLINPAMKPYELLLDYLGENTNLYTGESYQIEMAHMADLKALEVMHFPTPQNTFLLTQAGDEVLVSQQAITLLEGAKMWIQPKGSHAFDDFSAVLPAIEYFFQASL